MAKSYVEELAQEAGKGSVKALTTVAVGAAVLGVIGLVTGGPAGAVVGAQVGAKAGAVASSGIEGIFI